jgi:hypothetical protein
MQTTLERYSGFRSTQVVDGVGAGNDEDGGGDIIGDDEDSDGDGAPHIKEPSVSRMMTIFPKWAVKQRFISPPKVGEGL